MFSTEYINRVGCVNCFLFLSLGCTSVAANFHGFLYKGKLKEITPTTLHSFSYGVPCTILIVLAEIWQHTKVSDETKRIHISSEK